MSTASPPANPASAGRISALILGIGIAWSALVAGGLSLAWIDPSFSHPDAVHHAALVRAHRAHTVALATLLTCVLLVRRRRVDAWVPRALLPAGLAGLLVSFDLLASVQFPPPRENAPAIFDRHKVRGWTNRPGSESELAGALVRFDERGLRVRLLDHDESPDVADRRILFVGDSVTLGYGLPAKAAFGSRAVAMLNDRPDAPPVVGLNGGTCGYDTHQELHWFRRRGLPLEPDLVVLQFCLNDLTLQFDPANARGERNHPELEWSAPTAWSGLFRAAVSLRTRWIYGRDLHAAAVQLEHFDLMECLKRPDSARVQAAWTDVERSLDLFADVCRDAGLPLVIVCFPVMAQVNDPSIGSAPQVWLDRFATRRDLSYLDLLPVYIEHFGSGAAAAVAAFRDSTHPSDAGHLAAAQAVARLLESHPALNDLDRPLASEPGAAPPQEAS